jgi:hypothetical protein
MPRPMPPRRLRARRLVLERLEALCLPGETLLPAIGAALAAEQLSTPSSENSAPPHISN